MKRKLSVPGWQDIGADYENSASRELINQAVARLVSKHLPIFLASKGYQSGPTILIEANDQGLLIDRPRDWLPCQKIRLIFKDETKLTNHFDVRILAESADTLQSSLPGEIFRLQRRASYRVDVPRGCHVSFRSNDNLHTGLTVKNISARGMLFCSKKPVELPRTAIQDIALSIPAREEGDILAGWHEKKVSRGEVVRTFHDRQLGIVCYGVAFRSKRKEEDELTRYIRQRERELLLKGVPA
ncbi:MAG: flagellar brake protein [Desulfurivibrionaceae bacterium]